VINTYSDLKDDAG